LRISELAVACEAREAEKVRKVQGEKKVTRTTRNKKETENRW